MLVLVRPKLAHLLKRDKDDEDDAYGNGVDIAPAGPKPELAYPEPELTLEPEPTESELYCGVSIKYHSYLYEISS